MFIPLDRKPDWHRPPVVTLLLIAINILIFNFLQGQDQQREADAFHYYISSGLAELEMPHYIRYLNQHPGTQTTLDPNTELDTNQQKIIYQHLMNNGLFLQALKQSHIISADDPVYAVWQGLRQSFDKRLQNIFTYHFSLKPYLADPFTLVSALFLHADAMHLLGNMIFLLLFGFILELSLGSIMLLLVFMACGITANLVTLLITPNSAQWIMGASGAITGLAGLYSILYGMRKIRFFYTLIFYFDYVRAPAIIMLPAWLLYELAYNFISPNNVSTVTHIGGLLGGIFIGFIIKYSPLKIHGDEEEKDAALNIEAEFRAAMNALSNSELDKARDIFIQLLETRPADPKILLKLFHIANVLTDKESAQHYIQKLLMQNIRDPQLLRDQHRSFIDYMKLTKDEPNLPSDLLVETGIRFCHAGFIESSEKILDRVLQQNPNQEKLPALLYFIATRYHKSGNAEKSQHYMQLLTQRFSTSPEAQSIQETLVKH